MCRQALEWRGEPLLLSCAPGSPVLPLLTFAQSSSPARELPRQSDGFHVDSGRATPIIGHSPAGPKQRLSTKKIGLDGKELAFESSPASVREWQRRELPGHGRTARRRPRGSGIPSPRAARFGRRGRQLSAYEEVRRGAETMVRKALFEGRGWPNNHHVAAGRRAIFNPVDANRSAAGTLPMSHGR
jgi:hypothetical protein